MIRYGKWWLLMVTGNWVYSTKIRQRNFADNDRAAVRIINIMETEICFIDAFSSQFYDVPYVFDRWWFYTWNNNCGYCIYLVLVCLVCHAVRVNASLARFVCDIVYSHLLLFILSSNTNPPKQNIIIIKYRFQQIFPADNYGITIVWVPSIYVFLISYSKISYPWIMGLCEKKMCTKAEPKTEIPVWLAF